MSEYTFKCICCNTAIDVTPDQVGYVVYCPGCMAELIVPEFSTDAPPPNSSDPDIPVADQKRTDSVVLQDSFGGHEDALDEESLVIEDHDLHQALAEEQDAHHQPDGEPTEEMRLPDDVTHATASGVMDDMTDTKLALEETLKALQEHQRALAEARRLLAERKALQSDTNLMQISETTNKLIQENQPEAEMPTLEDASFVFETDQAPVEEEPQPELEDAAQHDDQDDDASYQEEVDYHPFYTPHGEFLPFTDEDIAHALQHESDETIHAISQITPGPTCWSYGVFAHLLEAHVAARLPQHLPISPMSGVFFGSSSKYLDEARTQHTIFMNVMRRMVKPMGVQFQFAIKNHDIYAFIELIYELEVHLSELHQFMMNFQQVSFPKKDPFIRYREAVLQSYDHVRHRLMCVVSRLQQRSELTPEQAMLGTISVSLNPPQVHEMALLLDLFPVQ